jgi:hypothetical protein
VNGTTTVPIRVDSDPEDQALQGGSPDSHPSLPGSIPLDVGPPSILDQPSPRTQDAETNNQEDDNEEDEIILPVWQQEEADIIENHGDGQDDILDPSSGITRAGQVRTQGLNGM